MFTSNLKVKTLILLGSLIASILLYYYAVLSIGSETLRFIKLEEWYGIISVWFLFLAMLAGPLYRVFPNAPYKNQYRQCLGGFGISTFYFALLHACINFFVLLKGFAGLPYIATVHLIAIVLGFIALLILAVMAGTSFGWAIRKLGKTWKKIQQLVYVAGIALILHVLLVGTHFRSFTNWIALSLMLAFFVLIGLHAISTRNYLALKYPTTSRRMFSMIVATALIILVGIFFIVHTSIHAPHLH